MRALDFRLHWVAADPDRERAVDALGLGAQADRIADYLLPGLSVQTRRARYLSFFCWAIKRTDSQRDQLKAIHRLEAELACEEAEGHRDEPPSACPDVVGRQRARQHLLSHEWSYPQRPELLYKNMAFAAYRPLMRAVGLVLPGRRLALTSAGIALGAEYQKSRGAKPRCLGGIGAKECTRLRLLLGLDFRASQSLDASSTRRRATYVELASLIEKGAIPTDILQRYAEVSTRASESAHALHRAFAWEVQSLGLTLAFAMLLDAGAIGPVSKRLGKALSAASTWHGLRVLAPADDGAAAQVVALLRRAHRFKLADLGLDRYPGMLVEQLVVKRDIKGFLIGVLERHRQSKLGEAWVALEGGELRVLTPKKNLDLQPRARTYRLDAFAQLTADLGLVT
jgi:hypothetical protein